MLTKAPSSLMTQRKHSLIMSKWSPQIRTMLKWRVEWAHVFEEVLNDNNNALRGQARNNFGRRKKAFVVLWEKGAVRERARERSRGVGEVGVLNSDRKFQQKKLARVLTTQHCANGYTQMLMCMHTHSHTHNYTHTDTDLFCSSLSVSNHQEWLGQTCYFEVEQKCLA